MGLQRLKRAAGKQLDMVARFAESDAADREENARLNRLMYDALAVIGELHGVEFRAEAHKRRAFVLTYLDLTNGDGKGSRARIGTIAKATGYSRRVIEKYLAEFREWDLITTNRNRRLPVNRVNMTWIRELVAHHQTCAMDARTCAMEAKTAEKHAHKSGETFGAHKETCIAHPRNVRDVDRDSYLERTRSPPAATWRQLIELVGLEAAEAALERLTPFRRDVLLRAARSGETIPEAILESFLEVC